MIEGLRVAVVIPARNEAPFVGRVVATLPEWVDEAIVVDDGSEDDTAARAALSPTRARLHVLRNDRRGGVGAAIVRGYREALALEADLAVVMAGDGQMDPRDLPALVEPVVRGEADYVKGDRLRHPEVECMPLLRRFGTAALAALTSVAVGVTVHDSQCGYTAASRRALEAIDLSLVWRGYGYPNDLIARMARADLRIAEVVVRPVYADEASGLRPWHVVVMGLIIGRAWLARARA